MALLCEEFGISRVTGHKIWKRYQQDGSRGLYNRSRAPQKHPNQTPYEVENLIIRFKKERPHWGAPKIRELMRKQYPTIKLPAVSTVHCILDRHGLVDNQTRRNKGQHIRASYLSTPQNPNDLWCVDFKGQFRMGNYDYCYPLTLTDFTSQFILVCEALSSTEAEPCFSVFEEVFYEYGLPVAIRSDNGTPFASGNSAWNLTRLSVWWIRLGIKLEHIEPGNPQQNGRHERMHRTLKLETTKPAAPHVLAQQEKFNEFKEQFNFERPHQALEMQCPGQIYHKSQRKYEGLPDIMYPDHDKTLLTSNCGRVCIGKQKVHISKALSNQPMGLKEIEGGIWQVDFMDYTLGYFDVESNKFSPTEDPFGFRLEHYV